MIGSNTASSMLDFSFPFPRHFQQSCPPIRGSPGGRTNDPGGGVPWIRRIPGDVDVEVDVEGVEDVEDMRVLRGR